MVHRMVQPFRLNASGMKRNDNIILSHTLYTQHCVSLITSLSIYFTLEQTDTFDHGHTIFHPVDYYVMIAW